MFGRLKEKFTGGAKRLSGKTDLLEAGCAICALVAAADGNFSDDEAATALDRLTTHETLSVAFSTTQIEAAFDKQAAKVKKGISGRVSLKREIEEAKAKGSTEDLEMLFCIAVDIAAADGNIEQAEMKMLREIGVLLGGFDPTRYLA